MSGAKLGGVHRDLQTLYGAGTAIGLADRELLERFTGRGDEAAFATLVARHGPMVLAVSRGVLRCPHDAEDAFQATFLILARKAGTLRPDGSLGAWLHRVAQRVAVLAGTEAARRRAVEARAVVPEAEEPPAGGPWDDAVPLLHEELARLPEKYRGPIVLCDLESLTRDQAARQLGWPPGTVAGRLARGRDLLRARLARRSVAPAAILISLEAAGAAVASVPSSWSVAASGAASGVTVAKSVETLFKEAMRAMILSKMRRIALGSLTIGLGLSALAAALAWAGDREPERGPTIPLTGLVVDAEGRPLPGVAVHGSLRESGEWGRVVVETRTDDQGRFRLAMPADATRLLPEYGAIWAYLPGRLVASRVVRRGTVHGDVPIRLVLGPPSTTKVEVRDPDGKPVAGATVMPRVLNRDSLVVPDGLAERIAAGTPTDALGRATISALLPEEVGTVFVTAKGFGIQQFGLGHGQDADPGEKVLNLMPVGRVEGRIVGEPRAIRGVALTVVSWNNRSNPPPPPALALSYLTTDDEGRFAVPEAPEGTLTISGDAGEGRWYFASPEGLKVEAGRTTRVELRPKPGVLVRGIVREKGSGKPIQGVKVGPYRGTPPGETDALGRYTFHARPGRGLIQLKSTPEAFASLLYGVPEVAIPQDVAEFEPPPIELTRAGTVAGAVRDEKGRPVPGAAVAASWRVDEGPRRQGRRNLSVLSDGRGDFTVDGVPLAAAVTLTATAPGVGRMARPVIAHPGEPAALTLDPATLVAMRGRVVDGRANPVAGARVHLRRRGRHETGQIEGEVAVDFDGAYVLRAEPDGRFETPRGLDPGGEYSAIAEADGFATGQTAWCRAKIRAFPDLILEAEGVARFATLDGLVRDGSGRPVAGATVWASSPGGPQRPARIATDDRGRFRLDGLPSTGALVFVEAEGFRFHGLASGPGISAAKLTLTRAGETALGMKTLPPPLPRADELAIARRLIGPFADRVLKERADDTSAKFRTLGVLARVDPGRVLEAIAARPFKEGWMNDRLRADASLGLMGDNLDEALAVVESIESAGSRAFAFVQLCDRLPSGDREGKLHLLDRALLATRSVPEPGHKVAGIASVAEHWIDLGEPGRATRLLREFEPVARELSTKGWDAYARGTFAEELAQVDPDAALKLIAGLDEDPGSVVPDRHRLNIAQELAGRDPAAAERLLDGLKKPSSIVRHGARIGHAMAPKDPARARRIVDRMDAFPEESRELPFNHAYALGMMALALADADKAAARALLDVAYEELAGLAREGVRGFQDTEDAAVVAASLLPVAERIDQGLVPGFFWRAASFRGSSTTVARSKTMPDAILALLLARYDLGVARTLLEPLVAGGPLKPGDASTTIQAMAAVDPGRAVVVLDAVPNDPDFGLNPFQNPKNAAILDLAAMLAARPEGRWDRALDKLLHLWTVGREDIF